MFWRSIIDAYPDYAAYQKGRRIDPMQIAWTTDAHWHYFYVLGK